MLISLYFLTIIYTNTMGLIIINKCKPFIDKEIESKGYIKKELSDAQLLSKIIKDSVLFLIPGYYLKRAIDLTGKDIDLDMYIKEKEKQGEFIKEGEYTTEDIPEVDSIFKKEPKLSLGKYEKPSIYRAIRNNNSMYTDMRYPNTEDVDMDFWEEEEKDLVPYLETENREETAEIRKDPVQEYLSSISDEELMNMVKSLDLETIRKLKKDSENLLNNEAA